MNIGDRARFFDALSGWQQKGDVGNNDIYFKPATVMRVYHDAKGREIVDLKFDHVDHVRHGYFTNIVRSAEA